MDCKDGLKKKINSIVSKIEGQNKLSDIKKTVAIKKIETIGLFSNNNVTNQINSMKEIVDEKVNQIQDITETATTCLDILTGGCVDTSIGEINNIAKKSKTAMNTMINSVTGSIDSVISQGFGAIMEYINDVSKVKNDITDLDNYLNCSSSISDSDYIEFIQNVSDNVNGYLENMSLNDKGETDFEKTIDKMTENITTISNEIKNSMKNGLGELKNTIDEKNESLSQQAKTFLNQSKNSGSISKNYF